MSVLTRTRLAARGLWHYRRTHLGVLLGAIVAAAVLTGALLVGDSVRHSLGEAAKARIGDVDHALVGGERLFRSGLADAIAAEEDTDWLRIAPLLRIDGVASADGGARRANGVFVHGVDERFFALAPQPYTGALPGSGEALLNRRLATQLGASAGDEIVLRVEKPSSLTRDMVLATTEDAALALRVEVIGVLASGKFGDFSLEGAALPPFGAFLDLEWVQAELELGPRANVLLAEGGSPESLNELLARSFELADAELSVERRPTGDVELFTSRVFLDPAIEPVLEDLARTQPLLGILTYLVSSIQNESGEQTPYSMVSAMGPLGAATDSAWDVVPADLADDGIVVGDWLANDLTLASGDPLVVRYFVPSADRSLREESRTFRVRQQVPLEGLAGDRTLMPPFPGISDSAHCRDWEPGIPVELGAIRDVDEAYWEERKGTPKAFLSLAAGRGLWSSRFGSLTSVRTTGTPHAFARAIRERLDPRAIGLFFQDVRTPALSGSRSATDFGGLFLGLSFFLIVAALLLTTLLFVFGVEQRSAEAGVLMAVGYRARDVRRLVFREAAVLAVIGAVAGAALGTLYTRGVLSGLATVWSGAVASTPIRDHASMQTLVGGGGGALVMALLAIAWALRKQARRNPLELLTSSAGVVPNTGPQGARLSLLVAVTFGLMGLTLGLVVDPTRGAAAAGAFFGAGTLLLIAGIAFSRWLLARAAADGGPAGSAWEPSTLRLGLSNAARRPGRSLAMVALLACGTFLVVSIGVHRKSGDTFSQLRSSGTGGFALFGRSTIPVHDDLNTPVGRDAFALTDDDLEGVDFVRLRVRDGDDASCLNLGTPQAPRLVGVDPSELRERSAFSFADPAGRELGWEGLEGDPHADEIPGFADASSVRWTMKKSVGDVIEYTDERGEPFRVRIAGTLVDSVLQGHLVISEEAFRARFPGQSGYRMFLVDAPLERAREISGTVTRALEDVGLELVPAARRLDEFNAVQNTYLSIFQVLGGLGVLLGSIGLGVVVLRNALERRSELAVLRALGFSRRALRRLLLSEHAALGALGLGTGAAAALLALAPLTSGRASLPFSLALVALIALNALVWIWVAASAAVRGELVAALRNE
ncbi:MAG: ABC transporter permease [bacterium]|nr:ABC transporter permease [bacterium]